MKDSPRILVCMLLMRQRMVSWGISTQIWSKTSPPDQSEVQPGGLGWTETSVPEGVLLDLGQANVGTSYKFILQELPT